MEIFQRCDGVKFKLRVPLLTVSFRATTRVLTGSGGHNVDGQYPPLLFI